MTIKHKADQLEALAELPIHLRKTESFRLPPLILHPFSAPEDASKLLESTRANLTLQGMLPKAVKTPEELDTILLRGRYAELKMLFYIGKDLLRWMDQCADCASVNDRFFGRTMRPETFATFLIAHTPSQVKLKLGGWGVVDFTSLFRRSLGLHTVLQGMPAASDLTPHFLSRYHRHLDVWYQCRMQERQYDIAEAHEFTFDLYASGEYTLMLEKSFDEKTE